MLKSLYLWIERRQAMVLCLSECITPLPFVIILLGFHVAPQERASSLGLSRMYHGIWNAYHAGSQQNVVCFFMVF